MSWVIWDILVPLLITFCLGLGLGWMLWRWRRQLATHSGAISTGISDTGEAVATTDAEAMNIALIEERDNALQVANDAAVSVDALQARILELENSASDQGAPADSSGSGGMAEAPDGREATTELAASLEKERSERGRLEQALMDSNSRYKTLAAELESVVNGVEAGAIKDKAALQSKYERSIEKIAELEKSIGSDDQSDGRRSKDDREIDTLRAGLQSRDETIEELKKKLAGSPVARSASVASIDKVTDIHSRKAADKNAPVTSSSAPSSLLGADENTSPKDSAVEGESAVASAQTSSTTNLKSTATTDLKETTGDKTAGFASTKNPGKATDTSPASDSKDPEAGKKTEGTADKPAAASQMSENTGSENTAENDESKAAPVEGNGKTNKQAGKVIPASRQKADDGKIAAQKETVKPQGAKEKKRSAAANDTGDESPTASKAGSEPASGKVATASGYVPVAWTVPDKEPAKDERDKLTDIKGVGPVLEKVLHSTGIYYFQQVAMLDESGIDELQQQIPQFPGRIQRDQWVDQAGELYKKKYGG